MIRSKNAFKKQLYEDISNEPVNIHCICSKCNERIILPEKVWLKRGAICNACYNRIHEED